MASSFGDFSTFFSFLQKLDTIIHFQINNTTHRLRQDHNIWLILVHSDGELGAWEGWPNELSIFVVIIVVGHFTIQRRLVTLSAVNAGSQDQPKIEIKNRLTLNVYIGAKDIVQFNILLHDLLIQIITLPWWSG